MIIKRRTFEAAKFPEGSAERNKLNTSTITSEYMPSYKYVVCDDSGRPLPFSFRDKQSAVIWVELHTTRCA